MDVTPVSSAGMGRPGGILGAMACGVKNPVGHPFNRTVEPGHMAPGLVRPSTVRTVVVWRQVRIRIFVVIVSGRKIRFCPWRSDVVVSLRRCFGKKSLPSPVLADPLVFCPAQPHLIARSRVDSNDLRNVVTVRIAGECKSVTSRGPTVDERIIFAGASEHIQIKILSIQQFHHAERIAGIWIDRPEIPASFARDR